MEIQWEEGFTIAVEIQGDEVVLRANREGLRSLAGQFLALAEETPGTHINYDAYNSLEDGSSDLVVELIGDAENAAH